MEDAATAEISRSQLWQWRPHGVALDDGRPFDARALRARSATRSWPGSAGRSRAALAEAADLLDRPRARRRVRRVPDARAYALLD